MLLHDPKVLLLDEPASGLDPRARIEIRELLKELKKMGKTILISSHILPELADLCNKVGIIERGDLIFAGTVEAAVRKATMGQVLHCGGGGADGGCGQCFCGRRRGSRGLRWMTGRCM